MDIEPEPSPPPLDSTLMAHWRRYLDAWDAGNRHATQQALEDFLTRLEHTQHSTAFARWVCQAFFDHPAGWSGQWGGGMMHRHGQFVKLEKFALSAYPILSRVMLPYLLTGFEHEQATQMRWLSQFLIGQGYRVRPEDRARIATAITDRYGPGADALTLLDRAVDLAPADQLSQRLHRSFQDKDDD